MDPDDSTDQNTPLSSPEAEAKRLIANASEQKVTAAPLGGVAIFLRCPSAAEPPLHRAYKDIDLVTAKSMTPRLTILLEVLGYAPDKRFNALHGSQRLFFWDERNSRQLDVFVDRFEMCHTFDLRNRLMVNPGASTLPLADLLLTKMQVVELNFKDMQDMAALLQDHPLTDDEEGINVAYITGLTRNDWGLQHTFEGTIAKLRTEDTISRLTAPRARFTLPDQLDALVQAMAAAPKSTGWKLRSKVGEHKRWYELPEEARA